MVVEGETNVLESVVAAVEGCYCHARMACCRAARPVTRRLERRVQEAVAQDMYTDMAGRQESKASATERMERRD
jgi:hypothetical protein